MSNPKPFKKGWVVFVPQPCTERYFFRHGYHPTIGEVHLLGMRGDSWKKLDKIFHLVANETGYDYSQVKYTFQEQILLLRHAVHNLKPFRFPYLGVFFVPRHRFDWMAKGFRNFFRRMYIMGYKMQIKSYRIWSILQKIQMNNERYYEYYWKSRGKEQWRPRYLPAGYEWRTDRSKCKWNRIATELGASELLCGEEGERERYCLRIKEHWLTV